MAPQVGPWLTTAGTQILGFSGKFYRAIEAGNSRALAKLDLERYF